MHLLLSDASDMHYQIRKAIILSVSFARKDRPKRCDAESLIDHGSIEFTQCLFEQVFRNLEQEWT
jgi:hypothetical protein